MCKMSNYVRALLIGMAVGFTVAFSLRFLYEPGSNMPLIDGVGAGLIAAYALANLAGNRAVAAATAEQKAQALGAQPPAGKALLYIYREGFVAKLAGLNVTVDGQVIAQLKSPQFTCMTLAPGSHIVSAAFGGLAGPQNVPAKLTIDTLADSVTALRITTNMGLARNGLEMTPKTDLGMAKQAMAKMVMVKAEVGEA
jgi:hypothetical protein